MQKNITLIGMPGSGKSTVGVLLAKAIGYGFVDTDLIIQQREGALLQDILDTHGVEHFLEVEEQAICSVTGEGMVISPGGSVVCREGAIAHLHQRSLVIYLDIPLTILEQRIENMTTRGIAMEEGQTLADLYHIRTPLYHQYAHHVIESGGLTIEETVAAVMATLYK